MQLSLLDLLECPYDHQAFVPSGADASGTIHNGILSCSRCSRRYPVREGIACMLPDPLRSDGVPASEAANAVWQDKRREIEARDAQVPQYDHYIADHLDAIETSHLMRAASRLSSRRRMLEIGAGTGRMTLRLMPQFSEIVALDFSFDSLRVLGSRLASYPGAKISLVQADASLLPFKAGVFDSALSAQALHHVPKEARVQAFEAISRVLAADAPFVLTVYHYDAYRRLRMALGLRYPDIEKEGYHLGKIYYNCFTRRELRQELSPSFEIERMVGIVNLPRELFSRLGHSGFIRSAAAALDKTISLTPAASSLGLVVMASMRKRKQA